MMERERNLLAEQARRGSLVLFIGSGVSVGAGLPTWKQLVDPLLKELGVEGCGDPLDEAQWYVDAKGRASLLSHVRQAISASREPAPLHKALARLAVPVVFTTNYDRLMERAIEEAQGVPPDVVLEDGHVALIDEARRTTVVKLHGCLSVPDTIVLARDDYETYADTHRAMIAYLQSVLATRTLLFVGCSLTDPNFRNIQQVIRRALGKHRRQAYSLGCGAEKWPPQVVKFWEERHIKPLVLKDADAVTKFVEEVAQESTRDATGYGAVQTLGRRVPPPPFKVAQMEKHLQALLVELGAIVGQAREYQLLREEGWADLSPDVTDAGSDATGTERWVGEKARALLELALAVDRLKPVEDCGLWLGLGDLLYERHDSAGAIQAYSVVLRPSVDGPKLDPGTLRHLYGNLARAHTREGHFARAEWLLRRCVFKAGQELSGEPLDAEAIFARLDLDRLRSRPTDASELAYAVSRRAEDLLAGKHHREAFEALREARYVLGPLLGVSRNPEHRLDYFDAELERRPYLRTAIVSTPRRGASGPRTRRRTLSTSWASATG